MTLTYIRLKKGCELVFDSFDGSWRYRINRKNEQKLSRKYPDKEALARAYAGKTVEWEPCR